MTDKKSLVDSFCSFPITIAMLDITEKDFIPTGMKPIQEQLAGGFKPGELHVFQTTGKPSPNKSALWLSMFAEGRLFRAKLDSSPEVPLPTEAPK